MGGTKGFKVKQYDITIEHDKGIQVLQRYFAKRIKTSNSKDKKAFYKKCLGYCNDIKRKAMYSEEERATLNRFRKNYNIYYNKKT